MTAENYMFLVIIDRKSFSSLVSSVLTNVCYHSCVGGVLKINSFAIHMMKAEECVFHDLDRKSFKFSSLVPNVCHFSQRGRREQNQTIRESVCLAYLQEMRR